MFEARSFDTDKEEHHSDDQDGFLAFTKKSDKACKNGIK